jgi:hypothetical protein
MIRAFNSKVIDFIDTPELFEAALTNVPASSALPLQIVAALNKTCYQLIYDSTIGKYMGLYSGPPGQEVLVGLLSAGNHLVLPVSLNIGTRLSLRAMRNSPINAGWLTIQFLGET